MGNDAVPLVILGVCMLIGFSGLIAVGLFDLDTVRSAATDRGAMIDELNWTPFDRHPDAPAFGRAYTVVVKEPDGSRFRDVYAASWTGRPERVRRTRLD
jgi:hypothetical protein